jgi:ferric-dicitrate binding protein FerR (iron transport regulator)
VKSRIKYLFIQYYKNQSTKVELDEFFDILNSGEKDEEIARLIKTAYEEVLNSHPSLTYINKDGELVVNDDIKPPTKKEVKSTFSKRRMFSKVAILFLLMMLPGIIWLSKSSLIKTEEATNVSFVKQFTNRGEHKYLLLEDGTQVWLNAKSTLSYPEKFDGDKREVYLTGEAFFDVKHADKIPFYIHTGDVVTKVLGTSFNIKAYPDQQSISVAVKRGKVSVLKTDKVVATLTQGKKVKINEGISNITNTVITDDIIKEEVTEEKEVGAWQRGYFIYRDEIFADIISDMEQIYNTRITIENKDLYPILTTTSFNQDIGVEEALSILCKLVDAQLVVLDKGYLIKKPAI